MSIVYSTAETSWLTVTDAEEFLEFCRIADVEVTQDSCDPMRFTLRVGNGKGAWPSSVKPVERVERWPVWLPIPPEGEERIREIAARDDHATTHGGASPKETWMADPEQWPEQIEFDLFNAVRCFMSPDTCLAVRWFVFDRLSGDFRAGGLIVCQDGRTIYADLDAAIDIAMASAQTELDDNCLSSLVPASADLRSGSLRAGLQ
jgi:hypothetical protein